MSIRDRVSVLVFGLVLLSACSQARPPVTSMRGLADVPHTCQPSQADAASDMVDQLDTWQAVAKYFRAYRQCDEGGIAEGSSEAIARLLVDHWSTLPRLQREIMRAPGLRPFVMAHVNTTLDTGDLQKIAAQAASSCPPHLDALCAAFGNAATQALK